MTRLCGYSEYIPLTKDWMVSIVDIVESHILILL